MIRVAAIGALCVASLFGWSITSAQAGMIYNDAPSGQPATVDPSSLIAFDELVSGIYAVDPALDSHEDVSVCPHPMAIMIGVAVTGIVPEPSSVALFGIGTGGLLYAACRRRKKRVTRA